MVVSREATGSGRALWNFARRTGGGLLAAVLLLLALLASRPGPDFGRYMHWAAAFLTADISHLASATMSPLGLPVTTWSHGPGAVFALGGRWLTPIVPAEPAAQVIGWLCAIAFWGLLAAAVRRATRGNPAALSLALAVAFVATHAGYYSLAHATESLTLPAVALLACQAIQRRRFSRLDVMFTGFAIATLLIMRSYFALYAIPVLFRLAHDLVRTKPWRFSAQAIVLVSLPITLAALQVGFVQRWTTGSPLASPYAFGDANFRSLDFASPELGAVLLHPWHGLLVYHPWYAAGFVLVLVQGAASRSHRARWFFRTSALAIALNLYVQSAWVMWWMGRGTFGMRGLAPAAVPIAIAFADFLGQRQRRVDGPLVLTLAAALLSSVWSFLLLLRGDSDLFDYASLVELQRQTVSSLFSWIDAGAFAVAFGTLVLVSVRARATASDWLMAVCGGAIGGCAVSWLWAASRPAVSFEGGAMISAGALLVALIGAAAVLVDSMAPHRSTLGLDLGRRWHILVASGIAALFLLVTAQFVPLAISAEHLAASGGLPRDGFRYSNTFQVEEIARGYAEYSQVTGFTDKKSAFAAFLRGNMASRLPAP